MATLDEQITALEDELILIAQNGQSIQSEHYKHTKAKLADLMKARSILKSEEARSNLSLQSRFNYVIPRRI